MNMYQNYLLHRYLLIFISLIFSSSCSSSISSHSSVMTETKSSEKFIENRMIKPGEVRWVSYTSTHPDVILECRGEKIKTDRKILVAENKIEYFGIVRESYFSDLKPFDCHFFEDEKKVYSVNFKILEKKFKEEKLRVSPRTIKLSDKDQERANREQVMLNKIYSSSLGQIQFGSPFASPLKSTITSFYGTKRVYNKQKKGQHLGTDYRASIGVKIPASNSGKVAFAGDLFYTGWTVIIDHGLDIFSVYGHLSKTLVQTGDFVEKGQVIALSGNTGRTSGPHLHWGVKVQGQYIDGLVLVDESQKFFQK